MPGYWDPEANEGTGCWVIGGSCTSLDSSGYGTWGGLLYSGGELVTGADGPLWYISGVLTTLDGCGNGSWNGGDYIDGTLNANGYSSCGAAYWINGQQTTLDLNGSGSWSSFYYVNGVQTPLDQYGNGTWNGSYYLAGASATPPLDQYGNGFYGGYWYIGGTQSALDSNGNGWDPGSNTYYIGGVVTSLNESGNGNWNGSEYVSGAIAVVGVTFTGSSDGDLDNVANWVGSSGTAANVLPALDGTANVTISGSLTSASSTVLPTSFNNVTVTTSGVVGVGLNVTNITFLGSSYFDGGNDMNTLSVSGTATFRDQSSIRNGGTVSGGTTVFRNRATNRNKLDSTSLVSAHGGGINGSNILGFA